MSIITSNQSQAQDQATNQVLKATALIYLEEALLYEQYEICTQIIEAAKSFGALSSEISAVLAGLGKALYIERAPIEAKVKKQRRPRY